MCGVRGRGGGGDSQTDPRLTPGQGPAEMTEAVIRGIAHPQWFNIIFSIYDKLNYHRTEERTVLAASDNSPQNSSPELHHQQSKVLNVSWVCFRV